MTRIDTSLTTSYIAFLLKIGVTTRPLLRVDEALIVADQGGGTARALGTLQKGIVWQGIV